MTKKARDEKNRWRNKTIAFRISPEENQLLEERVKLSGMTKQDYIIHRCLQKDIVVHGNTRVFKALRDQLQEIHEELARLADTSSFPDDFLEVLEVIAITLYGLSRSDVTRVAGANQITAMRDFADSDEEERGDDSDLT